jgi:hypothetical protein
MSPNDSASPKKPAISLTPGSRVRIYSAGARDEPIESTGTFRGLVSVGGDNSVALEIEETSRKEKDEKGRIRLIPLNAIMAIDILHAVKVEEEKRSDPVAAAGYFR